MHRSRRSNPRAVEGDLLVIGGAEDKLGQAHRPEQFVAAGRRRGCTHRGDPDRVLAGPGDRRRVRRRCSSGSAPSEVLRRAPRTRAEASSPELVGQLDRATGIFMTGGNQLKLSTVIAGTPFGEAIVAAHGRGVTIGGHVGWRQHPVLAHGRFRHRAARHRSSG